MDYLFFTHHHFDHNLDYPHIVLTRWDQGAGKIKDLRVFGPPPTERMTDQLFGQEGVYDSDIVARTNSVGSIDLYLARGGTLPRQRPRVVAQDISGGVVCSGDGWLVRAALTTHVEHLRSLAYRVDSTEGTIVFAGDTEPCRSVVELSTGADVLIHPCNINSKAAGATPPIEAGRVAAAAGVRTLVLIHLGAVLDQTDTVKAILTEVARTFGGNVLLGIDEMEIL
jgi:ribonuclease BN (tRNA processing enzyme)